MLEHGCQAVALGKKTPLPVVGKVRVLLPLGVRLTVLDMLIAGALTGLLAVRCSPSMSSGNAASLGPVIPPCIWHIV